MYFKVTIKFNDASVTTFHAKTELEVIQELASRLPYLKPARLGATNIASITIERE